MAEFLQALQQLLDALKHAYDSYGYWIILLSSFIENTFIAGLLLPGVTLVMLGAVYAGLGSLSLPLVILVAMLGAVFGYHVDYIVGRFFLGKLLPPLSRTRLGKRWKVEARIRQARMLLGKHGGKIILISHLVSTLRSFIAVGAGFAKMSYRKFVLFELLASLLWNTAFACIGFFVGQSYQAISNAENINVDGLAVMVQQVGGIAFLLIALFFLFRYLLEGKERRAWRKKRALRLPHRKPRSEAHDSSSS